MRRLRATSGEVEAAVKTPIGKTRDAEGNALYFGYVAGALVWIVVASDDPEFIITVFEEDRR
jgi:hypothetical protein